MDHGIDYAKQDFVAETRRLTGGQGADLVLHAARVKPMVQRHLESVVTGALQIVIDRRYPLADAADALAFIETRMALGRVLLIP